ncbi:MAG: hypothetical protein ACI9NQ_002190, partial [Paracoccaceae bacterium]
MTTLILPMLNIEHGLGNRGDGFQTGLCQNAAAALANFLPELTHRTSRFPTRGGKLAESLGLQGFDNRQKTDFRRGSGQPPASGFPSSTRDQPGPFEFMKDLSQKTGWYR